MPASSVPPSAADEAPAPPLPPSYNLHAALRRQSHAAPYGAVQRWPGSTVGVIVDLSYLHPRWEGVAWMPLDDVPVRAAVAEVPNQLPTCTWAEWQRCKHDRRGAGSSVRLRSYAGLAGSAAAHQDDDPPRHRVIAPMPRKASVARALSSADARSDDGGDDGTSTGTSVAGGLVSCFLPAFLTGQES